MFYSENGIFLSDKQFQLLNALYEQDLALKDFESKAGLIYEDWLEILIHEDHLSRFIEVTERNDFMETIFHLNSEGRAIVETARHNKNEYKVTRMIAIIALVISAASLLIDILQAVKEFLILSP